ncbi:MAG: prephenate dehydratase [Lachnospiraceae bacterium]|nr:prephenate dehydratase [Lachnospiraceae bacterium]
MELSELREQIDEVDAQIVALYEKRMKICASVAEYKIGAGKSVLDRGREAAKIQAVKNLLKDPSNARGIEELYQLLMSNSRKLQYKLMTDAGTNGKLPFIEIDSIRKEGVRVCYQGAEGSYSQAAMIDFFGEGVNNFSVKTFRDAMIAIEEGTADYAVLPIENSTAGVVSEIYDLLAEFENYIVAEQITKVEHCLLATEGTDISTIKRVYSHPQSLSQSARFLEEHADWEQFPMKNNAFAAKKVADEKDPAQAAVAGAYAAKVYGLDILERGINMDHNNSTRFIIITNQKVYQKGADKISICFEIHHESGSLYHILSHFIFNDLNMTKIESRPIEDHSWEYRFFVDFEGNLSDASVKNALRGIREEAANLRVLGNY